MPLDFSDLVPAQKASSLSFDDLIPTTDQGLTPWQRGVDDAARMRASELNAAIEGAKRGWGPEKSAETLAHEQQPNRPLAPVGAALDWLHDNAGRPLNALISGVGAGLEQVGTDLGYGTLTRDLLAMPGAFMGMPGALRTPDAAVAEPIARAPRQEPPRPSGGPGGPAPEPSPPTPPPGGPQLALAGPVSFDDLIPPEAPPPRPFGRRGLPAPAVESPAQEPEAAPAKPQEPPKPGTKVAFFNPAIGEVSTGMMVGTRADGRLVVDPGAGPYQFVDPERVLNTREVQPPPAQPEGAPPPGAKVDIDGTPHTITGYTEFAPGEFAVHVETPDGRVTTEGAAVVTPKSGMENAPNGPWEPAGKNGEGQTVYRNPNGVHAVTEDGVPYIEATKDGKPAAPDERKPVFQVEGPKPEQAVVKVEEPEPEPEPEIVEHTTRAGEVLRGTVRTDLTRDQAKELDPYTFRKDGGWFIRLPVGGKREDEGNKPPETRTEPDAAPQRADTEMEAGTSEPETKPEMTPERRPKFDPPGQQPPDRAITPGQRSAQTAPTSSGYVMLDPDQLHVDPERFQYKTSDDKGVTGALRGTEKWHPELANPITAWEDEDGKLYVVNGHQRTDLARRAKAAGQNVEMPARVFRAEDGYTPEFMRALGAYQNIAEGSGTPIDAARIMRTAGSLPDSMKLPGLPPKSALVQHANGLVNLSDEAFGAVANGVVPPEYAAQIGALISDPREQMAAMDVLNRAQPANIEQARLMVQDIRNSGFLNGEQTTLFGDEAFSKSLIPERARVLETALRSLRRNKTVFRAAVEGEDALTSAGNKLDRDANVAARTDNERLIETLQREATSRGPISDALSDAARQVAAGKPASVVAPRFIAAARELVARGTDEGRADGDHDGGRGQEGEGPVEGQGGFFEGPPHFAEYTAFHGTPHEFDRFDTSKIGTGEGAQAYGHGLYFAQNEGVARNYRDALSTTTRAHNTFDGQKITPALIRRLRASVDSEVAEFFKFTPDRNLTTSTKIADALDYRIDGMQKEIARFGELRDRYLANPPLASTYTPDDYARFQSGLERRVAALQSIRNRIDYQPERKNGNLYTVRINADPHEMLDWDKPLSEQPPEVLKSLRAPEITKALEARGFAGGIDGMNPNRPISSVYEQIGLSTHPAKDRRFPAAASAALRRAGIKGITYLDAGSRGDGDGTRNIVVFDHNDIEITHRNGEPVTPRPMTLAEANDMFAEQSGAPTPLYSAVTRAVDALKQNKGTGEQMLAQIAKTPGVKLEEVKWLGLDDWLRGQKSVTKADIQDYVRANAVDVREIEKSTERLSDLDHWAQYHRRALTTLTKPEDVSEWRKWNSSPSSEIASQSDADVWQAVQRMRARQDNGQPKYQSYTLPGGENYRELLLTLPPKASESGDSIAQRLFGKPFRELSGAQKAAAQNEANRLDREETYRSSHWDEPNVLAHVRFDERTAPDGARVLLVQEIQSDWGQAARKKGTYDPSKPWEVFDTRDGVPVARFATEAEAHADAERRGSNFDYDHAKKDGAVPPMPMERSWPMLAMRRMIKYAADNGFDRIAWSPGEVHADRYDLSRHIKDLTLNGQGDDLQLTATDHTNHRVIDKKPTTRAGLADLVGKEVADKLLSQPEPDPKNPYAARHLFNADLKVGGEGMRGFYDRILPAETNKIIGKYGAKVGRSEVPVGKPDRDTLRPDAQAIQDHDAEWAAVVAELNPLHEMMLRREIREGDSNWGRMIALQDELNRINEKMVDETYARSEKREPVHSFDLTPQLEHAAQTEGMALFQSRRLPAPPPSGPDLFGTQRQAQTPRTPEPTIRNDPAQAVMPGMEPSARQAQASRDAAGPRSNQKSSDEGLFARPETEQPSLLPTVPGWVTDLTRPGESVAWHDGKVALIRARSLTGKQIYVPAKEGVGPAHVDLDTYTGTAFTVAELLKLRRARREAATNDDAAEAERIASMPKRTIWPNGGGDNFRDMTGEISGHGHDAAADWVFAMGHATGHEHIAVVDNRTGEIVHAGTNGQPRTVSLDPTNVAGVTDAYTVHHNHPSSSALSWQDIGYLANRGVSHVVATGHDTTTTIASLRPEWTKVLERWPHQLAEAVKAADALATKMLGRLVYERGTLSAQAANKVRSDIANRLLHAQGVIDYKSTIELPEPASEALAEELRSLGYDDDRRAITLRAKERTGSLPEAVRDRPRIGNARRARSSQGGQGVSGADPGGLLLESNR